MTIKITAKVIEPLLTLALENKTLARMSKGEDFNSIEILTNDDFIDYICTLGSLDPISLGADRKNGINRQVIYAERNLRRKGVCRKCGRGRYGLAVAPVDQHQPVSQPVVQPVVQSAVVPVVVQQQIEQVLAKDLLYDRPSSFAEVGIFADPHFRNIAISQSKCFGRYSSDKRSACSGCSLAEFCFEKQNLDLEAFALRYTEQQAQPQPQPISSKSPSKALSKGDKLFNLTTEQSARCRKVTAQISADCTHCGKVIDVGAETLWVPGGGTFHSACVSTNS